VAAPLYFSHPDALNVLYGSIEGHAKAGAPVFAGTAGTVVTRRNREGFEFYAHRYYDGDDKQREKYIAGPAGTADADQRAEELTRQINEVKAMLPDLRLLGREGFQLADGKTYATLASLQKNGLFVAGAMLIGSHAFGVLLNHLGVKAAAYATEDIDIARREALAFPHALGKPLLEILRESGIAFVEVPKLDRRKPSTSFKQRGISRFHVDLLVPSRDASFPVVPVPELQTHATGLPYLGYLLGASQEAVLLARAGCCLVNVPLAERFAVHKLLLSQLRSGMSSKTDKDLFQACVLLAVLGEKYPGAIEDAIHHLPKSAGRYVRKALGPARQRMLDSHPRALQELEAALS
jgi:hypothetical protein